MTPPWPRLARALTLRALRQVPLVSHFLPVTPPPADGRGDDFEAEPTPGATVTMWQVIMYALDRTGRTVRLCVIILVAALAAMLVLK